jgi:hypothetical protein
MIHRLLVSVSAAFALLLPLAGQTRNSVAAKPATGKTWTVPRAADGHPDLEGIWSTATITPLERPRELGEKQFFTEQESADYEKRTLVENNRDRRDGPKEADVSRAYNDFWWDRGTKIVGTRRTSLIIDPSDGRIPAMTPEGQKAAAVRAAALQRPAVGPEDRGVQERCIVGTNVGPPMLPSAYNNNFHIMQNAGFVTILSEMVHDVRTIPVDGRPHVPQNIRQWRGDSRGHWEGNTLVVDTTNFNDQVHVRGSDQNLRVVERFTRASPDVLLYEFRIEDPTAFTKPWAGEIPMTKTEGPIYEYACHEGNYGMEGLLRAARQQDKVGSK